MFANPGWLSLCRNVRSIPKKNKSKVAHFGPESLVHFPPESVAQFAPESVAQFGPE